MNRNAAFGVGALLGAAAAIVWDRRSRLRAVPAPEARQRELREKLAGAQAEAQATDSPPPAADPPKAPEPPPPAPSPPEPPPPGAVASRAAVAASAQGEVRAAARPPPADEFEAMQNHIHQEGKAAAEEMRRASDEDS